MYIRSYLHELRRLPTNLTNSVHCYKLKQFAKITGAVTPMHISSLCKLQCCKCLKYSVLHIHLYRLDSSCRSVEELTVLLQLVWLDPCATLFGRHVKMDVRYFIIMNIHVV